MTSINLVPTIRDILGGGSSDSDSDDFSDICYLEKFIEHHVGNTAILYYKPGIFRCRYNKETYLKDRMIKSEKSTKGISTRVHSVTPPVRSSTGLVKHSDSPVEELKHTFTEITKEIISDNIYGQPYSVQDADEMIRNMISHWNKQYSNVYDDSDIAIIYNTLKGDFFSNKSYSDFSKKPSRGIPNEGNTCYANSLFQMLSNVPEWYSYLDKSITINLFKKINQRSNLSSMSGMYKDKIKGNGTDRLGTGNILTQCFLNMRKEIISLGKQEDVHEFYMTIVNDDNLQTFFWYINRVFIMCKNGKNKSKKDEIQVCLTLHFFENCDTISKLLIENFNIEEVTEESSHKEGCGIDDLSRGPFYKFTEVKIPIFNKYLFIQLSRFANLGLGYEKITDEIIIDYDITIDNNKFVLDGFIVHIGKTPRSGHYTYVKVNDDRSCICYDDATVNSPIPDYNISKYREGVYCLLYRKIT